MTNKQLHFGLATGVLLLMLGGAVFSQASTGISLMGLGVAIISLSLWSRVGVNANSQCQPQRISVSDSADHSLQACAQTHPEKD